MPTPTTLVVLAAGSSTRFGRPKQLTVVGPAGETITDVLIARAAAAGTTDVVVVAAPAIAAEMRAHVGSRAVVVVQDQPNGTGAALFSARQDVHGACVVVNADDLYPAEAFATLAAHIRATAGAEHAMVAFRADRTIFGRRPLSRALVEVDDAHALVAIREGRIVPDDDLWFEHDTLREPLRGNERVSMNMWVFTVEIFDALESALRDRTPGEVLLPDVVARLIATGATVRVLDTDASIVGLTHPEDVAIVRSALS